MKKIVVTFFCAFFWLGCAGYLVVGFVDLLRLQLIGLPLIFINGFAFWLIRQAYKQSRDEGRSSISEFFDDLGFRFCILPMLACGASMYLVMNPK